MRWFRIRKATIDPELRGTFEQYGPGGMQILLGTKNFFKHQGREVTAVGKLDSLLPWLTEQYDRAERKETWSITMEAAITIFVAAELLISIVNFVSRK